MRYSDRVGGLYAAIYLDKTLARRTDVEVTVISRKNLTLFNADAAQGGRRTSYLADIVSHSSHFRHSKFVEAEMQAIDLSALRVQR